MATIGNKRRFLQFKGVNPTQYLHAIALVPSMLIVAPSGKTKLEVRLDMPFFFSVPSIVNGSVAELDAVEKAFKSAAPIPLA